GVLGPLIVGLTVVVLVVGMVDVVLVFLIRVTFHSSGLFYGGTGAAWTAGIVAGSLGAGRLADERGRVRATVAGAAAACASLALCAAVPAVWMLLPLSIIGGIGNGYVSACFSSLLVARTADAERGRVSVAANAAVGSAQGVSLLVGGAVAAVFAPRVIYAMAGTLGLAAAGAVALVLALRSARPSGARGPRRPLRPDWHAEGVSSRLE
ncbi:MAG TPA: MFS transporter, partial [Acidimicrobiales bacterium]|nr:MFS transporter [Acidimicrobiales bacterium]